MRYFKKTAALALTLLLFFSISVTAYADKADFEYKLTVTDGSGRTVTNPRTMKSGDKLTVELELTRTDTNATSYDTYGLEFRLMSRGLKYNGDGASFANSTPVRELHYDSGDSVGFAYYDMDRVGQPINNPAMAGRWSYTVENPGAVNITVPVALMYIVNDSESYEPIGNAILYLDPNGGEIVGTDVSGEYCSGTIVTLPDASFADYVFQGWSDGADLYPAGANYVVTGIVTLTAQWEGLVRNRQVLFDPNGGEIVGDDPSGMYADGEIVTVPETEYGQNRFLGWEMGGKTWQPGDQYTVDNSVVFRAKWKFATEEMDDGELPMGGWIRGKDGTLDPVKVGGLSLLGLLALLLLLLLWKRRYVLYSLKNGDVALSHKEKEHSFFVEVVLLTKDQDGNNIEYHLNKSGVVEAEHRLRYIYGQEAYPIVNVETGKYEGKLIITDPAGAATEKACRIKVLDRELRERENK